MNAKLDEFSLNGGIQRFLFAQEIFHSMMQILQEANFFRINHTLLNERSDNVWIHQYGDRRKKNYS